MSVVDSMPRSIRKNAVVLGLFAAITVAIVALIQQGTASRIEQAREQAQLQALSEILPAGSYDNNLLEHTLILDDPLLGNRAAEPAYLAFLAGEPAAIILQATAPDGYSGSIRLLIGITADGNLAGVRVLEHHETPGLGDKIETGKSDWIHSFTGKSLINTDSDRWEVRKNRGDFDQFAGATITPSAVVRAVHKALQFFDAHNEQLFASALSSPTPEELP
ncbi:electron transport complex subunit RsxG [Thiopseudomonas denitrificans]|uniref:Ion-translocating oxidoreductase complex subunit G n=1 Tax=Thiopseudomonas denitrificans TaxID=1501432 RepID=A0A4V3D4M4_9GAMM|nr:electron transport complex subunit RsxG [Thiopseudomonas denitrificans]TDQ36837.1 electron transport complex protein RnfG [Thiopseudomonas denitrificans]